MRYVRTFRAFDNREMVHAYEHISSKQFNSITVAFVHGAKLNGTRWEKARVCWQWEMVDAMPKAYILRGMTTTDKAYNFGKELIDACYKANRVWTYAGGLQGSIQTAQGCALQNLPHGCKRQLR